MQCLLMELHPQKWNVLRFSSKKNSMDSVFKIIGDRIISAVATIDDLVSY